MTRTFARSPRLLLAAAFLLGGALAWPRLPDAVPAGAPPEVFSGERALGHIRAWSTAPRPTGSAAHAAVLDAIDAELGGLGFTVARGRATFQAGANGELTNLVAHAPGGETTGGVWLVAHTDSVPTSPGAADDGLGLGVAIEAARALSVAGVPPDLHVLFTDAEELGLLGARAHVKAAGVDERLVLNVEARGTEGPAYMFQLAGETPALLDAWRASGCGAQATSLARAVYDVMPNDTDFTAFRRAGWWGYDFALLGGAWRYHTPDDTAANLSPRSVQQVGDCVLGLARAWLGRPLSGARAAEVVTDRVYFQAPGGTLVLPPWVVQVVGSAVLFVFPWRRRALGGLAAWLGALVLALVGGFGVLGAALLARPDFWERPAEIVGPGPWYAAAAAIGLLAGAGMARLGREGWHLGGVLLGAGAALVAPAAGYVFVPGAWAGALLARGQARWALLPALLAGVLATPVLVAIFPALTTRALPILAVVPLLLGGWAVGPVGSDSDSGPR